MKAKTHASRDFVVVRVLGLKFARVTSEDRMLGGKGGKLPLSARPFNRGASEFSLRLHKLVAILLCVDTRCWWVVHLTVSRLSWHLPRDVRGVRRFDALQEYLHHQFIVPLPLSRAFNTTSHQNTDLNPMVLKRSQRRSFSNTLSAWVICWGLG